MHCLLQNRLMLAQSKKADIMHCMAVLTYDESFKQNQKKMARKFN